MEKKMLILIMTIIIALSGCTNTNNDFNPNAGAIIEKAAFDIQKVYHNEDTELSFDIVNVGGKNITAGDLNVYVYGPTINANDGTDGAWKVSKTTDITPSTIARDSGGYIKGKASSDFPASDPSMGIPGGREQFTIPLDPPSLLPGMEVPTNFYVSICFSYRTETITQIEITSKNELRATGLRSSRRDSINAAGPIHVNVAGDGNLRSSGSTTTKIPLVLKVQDVGGGFATVSDCLPDQPTGNRSRVKLTVTVDDSAAVCGGSGNTPEVKLKDGTGSTYCTYDASTASIPRHTFIVKTIAEYKYTLTSIASVTVLGSAN